LLGKGVFIFGRVLTPRPLPNNHPEKCHLWAESKAISFHRIVEMVSLPPSCRGKSPLVPLFQREKLNKIGWGKPEKGAIVTAFLYDIRRLVLVRGTSPFLNISPLSWKERGIKGVRYSSR
jgi:hypothetical protein